MDTALNLTSSPHTGMSIGFLPIRQTGSARQYSDPNEDRNPSDWQESMLPASIKEIFCRRGQLRKWVVAATAPTGNITHIKEIFYRRGQPQKWVVPTASSPTRNITQAAAPGSQNKFPAKQLDTIRQVLDPSVSDLADAFGVSRQEIYLWLDGRDSPRGENRKRIEGLFRIASTFQAKQVTHAPALLLMKACNGHSLLELVAAGRSLTAPLKKVVQLAKKMRKDHQRSGLAKQYRGGILTEDAFSEISIPGFIE